MKHTKIIFIVLLAIFLCTPVFADKGMTLTLPNGATIPLNGLSSDEVRRMSELLNKATAEGTAKVSTKVESKAVQIAAEAMNDPTKLDAWRKLITGTIKDTCVDLNVAVNDFIKTPVGLGVSALILYNVAGKDALGIGVKIVNTIFRVIILVPLWIIIMTIILFLRKKYLSTVTIYDKKKEIVGEDGKVEVMYTDSKLVTSYPWQTGDARTTFAVVLVIVGVVSTFATIALII